MGVRSLSLAPVLQGKSESLSSFAHLQPNPLLPLDGEGRQASRGAGLAPGAWFLSVSEIKEGHQKGILR